MRSPHLSRWADLEPYSPPSHTGTTNHRLLDGADSDERLSVVHGRLEAGGAALRHLHRRSAQVTHILTGHCTADLDGVRHRLGPGDTIYIPPGVWHEVIVDGDAAVSLINVYQPPLSSDDIHPATL